jgi:cytidylate kinase
VAAPSPSGSVIAIDGPAGAGKSTVAREVARRLGLRYLDTGSMYRAITWLALHAGVPLDDGEALAALARRVRMEVGTDPDSPRLVLDGRDLTSAVRGHDVTRAVSAVSAVPGVRTELVRRQREIIGAGGIVVEGRDIGRVVAPTASPKVFLTATPAVRANRRAGEEAAAGRAPADQRAELARRDRFDATRAASPLAPADDAVHLDTSGLSVEEVVARVLRLAGQQVSR